MKRKILSVLLTILLLAVLTVQAFADAIVPEEIIEQERGGIPWTTVVLIAAVVIIAAVVLIRVFSGKRK